MRRGLRLPGGLLRRECRRDRRPQYGRRSLRDRASLQRRRYSRGRTRRLAGRSAPTREREDGVAFPVLPAQRRERRPRRFAGELDIEAREVHELAHLRARDVRFDEAELRPQDVARRFLRRPLGHGKSVLAVRERRRVVRVLLAGRQQLHRGQTWARGADRGRRRALRRLGRHGRAALRGVDQGLRLLVRVRRGRTSRRPRSSLRRSSLSHVVRRRRLTLSGTRRSALLCSVDHVGEGGRPTVRGGGGRRARRRRKIWHRLIGRGWPRGRSSRCDRDRRGSRGCRG